MAPSLTLDSYRQIGRNAAGYALGHAVAPVPTVMDNFARAKLIVRRRSCTRARRPRSSAAASRSSSSSSRRRSASSLRYLPRAAAAVRAEDEVELLSGTWSSGTGASASMKVTPFSE